MSEDDTERLLQKYADSISDDEAWDAIRPEVREKIVAYGEKQAKQIARRRYSRLGVFGAGVTAVAACLGWLAFRPQGIELGLYVEASRGSLLTRGDPPEPMEREFHVGIVVSRTVWVSLVERTESGELFLLRPRKGVSSIRVDGHEECGPYDVHEPNAARTGSRVTHILAVASEKQVAEDRLLAAIPDVIAQGGDEVAVTRAIDEFANALSRDHGWVVAIRQIRP